ncbi:MAG: putative transport system permease protein, partial [Actinomycetota bacterium]|nr:putative transport system permease protein [Actinomycetota bacterium]
QGLVVGNAQLVGTDGKAVGTGGAPTFGRNWERASLLRTGTVVQGRAPRTAGEIAVNRGLLERTDYKVGDRAPVLTDGPLKKYRIVGVVEYDGKPSFAGETEVYFNTPTAQRVLNVPGAFSEITLAADDGVSDTTLRDRVRAVLPPQTEAITGTAAADEKASDVKSGLGVFNTFLLVFAFIALFVGAFIIFNTFSMLVAQRTRELALMRMLGASRGQVRRAVLLEAVVVGLISSLIGLFTGIGVALGLKAFFGLLGAQLPAGPTVVALRTVVVSFAVGTLVTAAAAFMPARRASRVAPLAALRDAATPDRSLRRQTIIGAIVLVAGAVAMTKSLRDGGLSLLGLGTLLAFIGVAMLSPLVSRPVASFAGRLFSRRIAGRLGKQNAVRNPRRTAATAAALMVGLALISAVTVLGSSLKASVAKIATNAVNADFILNTNGPGFPDAVMQEAAEQPGVRTTAAVKADGMQLCDTASCTHAKQVFVTAFPAKALGDLVNVTTVAGSTDLAPGTILISKDAAKTDKLTPGDTVTVQFARSAPEKLTVGGTYATNQLIGDYLVDASKAASFSTQRDVAGLVGLADGADAATVRKSLDSALHQYPNVDVLDQSEFVNQAQNTVNLVVRIINLLLGLSVLIALLGVLNTLALSVIERTREIGLLRAVGMARRQVKRMIRTEAVLICFFGGLLGLVVGSVFGIALQQALKGQGVSELGFPVLTLLVYLLCSALAGVVAAALPARRASRLNVLQAIATE